MTNTSKTIQRLAINIKSILKVNNMEYSQAFIDVNRIIILAGENTKPIRQLGIGIRTNECPADRDDRLYHEEQDIIAMNKAKENK